MAEFKMRWAQLDVARQMESIEFIEKFIVLLADSGYNGLELYLEDRIRTASYQYPAENETYTVDEIKHIIAFAAQHNMEVIPCVATLGHAERFLRHKETEHLAELQGDMKGRFGNSSKLTFCITHPEFYDFIGTYLKEVASIFPSAWFHIGLDEFWDFNMCERCKKAMPTLMDEQKMFIKHINKIRDIIQSCGKRVVMWSDMFEFYPDVFKEVPRDVLLIDWQYLRDIRCYQGHLLDVDNENRLAVNAACGFETLVAPADYLLSNSQSYFKYAEGKTGVLGGLFTCWEKNDNFIYRYLPNFVSGGLQMSGMKPDAAYDAMCKKLFDCEDTVFKSALKIAMNNGLYRHFAGITDEAILTRDYHGLNHSEITVCKSVHAILSTFVGKVTTEWGKLCLTDLLDALWEKSLSYDALVAAHDIFDNGCTADRRKNFSDFRCSFADYLDRMAARWLTYRAGITPNVFEQCKKEVGARLEKMENALASNAWIRVNGTLPDGFGVEYVEVEYKTAGEWHFAGRGVFKPSNENIGTFCRFIPLEKDFDTPVEAVRLTTHGLGGVGLNFVEVCANNGKRYVPRAVLALSGKVSDPVYLLNNNTTFAWFGGQSTRYDYFDRHAAEQRNRAVLEMQEFDTNDIAMAQK